MGEYYKWINIDKKEYISPNDFDLGNKLFESSSDGNPLLNALSVLLQDRWKNDSIIFLGDECNVPGDTENTALKELRYQRSSWGQSGYDEEYVLECYRNISCKFKESEPKVREEVEVILKYRDTLNEYGLDYDNPFDGMFLYDGMHYRFVLNESKRLFIDVDKLPEKKTDEGAVYRTNPLPLLMAYGRMVDEDMGIWIGDIITFADEEPEGYQDISDQYIW